MLTIDAKSAVWERNAAGLWGYEARIGGYRPALFNLAGQCSIDP